LRAIREIHKKERNEREPIPLPILIGKPRIAPEQIVQLLDVCESRHEDEDGARYGTEVRIRVQRRHQFHHQLHVDALGVQSGEDVSSAQAVLGGI
jgi:hypothetical protein